jgi:hypothetical protein
MSRRLRGYGRPRVLAAATWTARDAPDGDELSPPSWSSSASPRPAEHASPGCPRRRWKRPPRSSGAQDGHERDGEDRGSEHGERFRSGQRSNSSHNRCSVRVQRCAGACLESVPQDRSDAAYRDVFRLLICRDRLGSTSLEDDECFIIAGWSTSPPSVDQAQERRTR